MLPTGDKWNKLTLSEFIDNLDTTSYWDDFINCKYGQAFCGLFKRHKYVEDGTMIRHVNERLQFYMEHIALQTTQYQLLDIARSIVLELQEFDETQKEKGNSHYHLCDYFVKAVEEGIPNAGPFPKNPQLEGFFEPLMTLLTTVCP